MPASCPSACNGSGNRREDHHVRYRRRSTGLVPIIDERAQSGAIVGVERQHRPDGDDTWARPNYVVRAAAEDLLHRVTASLLRASEAMQELYQVEISPPHRS
jgi:hypothetical protein